MRRAFWSTYGRFVWQKHQPEWKQYQIDQVVQALKSQGGSEGKVLDAGCGTGEYAVALALAGFDVVGIDYAAGMLHHAGKKIAPELQDRLIFQQATLDEPLPFADRRFDHVINISVLQVTANPAFTLIEFQRVLNRDGVLFLLHVPRPNYQDWSLRSVIRHRIEHSASLRLTDKALIAVKAWAERSGKAHYWTVDELGSMLAVAGFDVFSVEAVSVIVIQARKAQQVDWRRPRRPS